MSAVVLSEVSSSARVENTDAVSFLKGLKKRPQLILTDPPYGMSYKANMPGDRKWNATGQTIAERSGRRGRFDVLLNDKPGQIDYAEVFRLCYKTLDDNGHFYTFTSWRAFITWSPLIEQAGFVLRTPVFWNKKCANGGDLRDPLSSVVEVVIHAEKGKPKTYQLYNAEGALRKRVVNIWHHGRVQRSEHCGHPTQKPLHTCEQLIRMSTARGDLVVDPFCGSGTALLAAAKLDREYMGCDLDPEYTGLARRRLAEHGYA